MAAPRKFKNGLKGHKEKPDAVLQVGPAVKRKFPPVRKPRYTKKQVRLALQASSGLLSAAARKLGCTRPCVAKYLQRYPDLKQEVDAMREVYIDVGEASLLSQVKKENTQATIFLLKCLGKHRGWVEDPKVQLHAHVDAGSGSWMDIMERAMAVTPDEPERPQLPAATVDAEVVESGDENAA